LLNTAAGLLVFDEFPAAHFSHLFDFARQLLAADKGRYEAWRALEAQRHERILQLLATAWALASRPQVWQRFQQRPPERVGMKTPLGELEAPTYEELLAPLAPVYVYCWRPPLLVYDSLLSLEWGCHHTPASFLELLVSSLKAALELQEKGPGRLLLFPVEAASRARKKRRQYVAGLFASLGLRRTWATFRFVRTWPPVNRRQGGPPSPLRPEEKQARLRQAAEALAQSQEVGALLASLGLEGQEPHPKLEEGVAVLGGAG
jgi:hypothetical protein